MKYLFVHQNYPGQFLHLVIRLAKDPANEIVFICEPNENTISGVRKFCYQPPTVDVPLSGDVQDFELATRRARVVERLGHQLLGLGFVPDIIIGHHGWGELLTLQDVWPGVPMLGYFEYFYHAEGFDVGFDPEFPTSPGGPGQVRMKNAVNLIALDAPGYGQTPTSFQLSTYPEWARKKITVLREGVYLDLCRPRPELRQETLDFAGFEVAPTDTLITYVARDLEPYRGFHTMMRALPRLHRLRGDLKVIMVGGNSTSYGARLANDQSWKDYMLKEVGHVIDPSRVHFPGRVGYDMFKQLLQRSDVHVYLTYPFVLSWSLREAMACGCAIVASDTAPLHEFITHKRDGYLVRFPDPIALADGVAEVLENKTLAAGMRRKARAFAEKNLGMPQYLAEYEKLIARVIAGG